MSFKYKDDCRFNCTQLRVKEIDELSETEIIKQNYDALWLERGQFDKMAELVAKHNFTFKYLNVYCWERQDITWVNSLSSLEYLQLDGTYKGVIDFSLLPNLKAVELQFDKSTKGILNSGGNIESIFLCKFKGSLHDFDENTIRDIKTLGLDGGTLTNLEGIEKFTNLKELSISRLMKLTNIDCLAKCEKVEHLEIDSCNKTENYGAFKKLTSLKDFQFSNKELPSLSLLPKETVERVVLGERTKILDGNVETFLEFPNLKRAVFRKMKDYKYSAIEIDEMMGLSKV